jgi:ferredoxin
MHSTALASMQPRAHRSRGRDTTILLGVNGDQHYLEVKPGVTLQQVLRDDLHLAVAARCRGAGHCAGCEVLADGVRIRSCMTPAAALDGAEIVTLVPAQHAGPPRGADDIAVDGAWAGGRGAR